jgi:hydroxymethylglutaryl-CoA lyase
VKATPMITLVEVGPRDGLQNQVRPLDIATKVELVDRLVACGFHNIEAGSFVSPKWVPQMADTKEVLNRIKKVPGVLYHVLVPNQKGFDLAKDADAATICIFSSASRTFSKKNTNCTPEESLERYLPVVAAAKNADIRVRGAISCVLGCPYDGAISPSQVVPVALKLYEMGCFEICLADTIGVGTPAETRALIRAVSDVIPVTALAGHFHDTYGQALANVWAAFDEGVRVFDASVSGLGGCPYAKGASGNVASEEIVYSFERAGYRTGINLDSLMDTSVWISEQLGRRPDSKVTIAHQSK